MTEGVDHQRLKCLFLADVGVVGLYKQSLCVCVYLCVSVRVCLRARVCGRPCSAPNFTRSQELRRFVGQG